MTSGLLFTWTCTNQTTSWLVHNWSIFGARTNHGQTHTNHGQTHTNHGQMRTNHGQTRTHKTHHGPDLGEAITFPLIVFSVPGHRTCTQMSFCQFENLEIETPAILEAHNFWCRLQIEVRFEAKLYPLSRAFQ